MSETIDSFIGATFSNLTVVAWDGSRRNGAKLYSAKCSVCSTDHELFGDGVFYATKHLLNQGKLPCGCGASPRWTEKQFTTRIERILSKQHVSVVSYGEYWGTKTKIRVKCTIDNYEWDTSYRSLLAGCGCNVCANLIKTVPDDKKISTFFMSGKFVDGTKFWRSPNKDSSGKNRWYSTCPICSSDKYVSAGVCSGIFESDVSNLYRGGLPCRCSTKVKWTKEQRELQMSESNSAFKFVRWSNNTSKPHDCAEFMCETHGPFETTAGEFLNSGRGCPKCVSHGFKSHLDAFLYVLEIQSESSKIVGFGITNDIDTRLAAHKRELGKSGLSIIALCAIKVGGAVARQMESDVATKFECIDIGVDGFRREATLSSYETVKSFVENLQH